MRKRKLRESNKDGEGITGVVANSVLASYTHGIHIEYKIVSDRRKQNITILCQ